MEITSEEIELRMQQIEYHLIEIMAFTTAETVRRDGIDTQFGSPDWEAIGKPEYWRSDPAMVATAERLRDRLRLYLTDLCAAYTPRSVLMMEQQSSHLAHVLAGVQLTIPYSPPGAGAAPTTGLWTDEAL